VVTLPGALVRNPAQPLIDNAQHFGGSVSLSYYGKVGPTAIVKSGDRDYRAWAEMVAALPSQGGSQTYGQTGTFDADTTVGYLTSTDGTTWTWYDTNVDGDPNRIITPSTATNPVGGSTAWMNGESVVDSVLYDTAAGLWKAWGHGGNNTGPRAIFYATSSDGISWTLQNNGQPVLQKGTAGAWDDAAVADPRVIRVSSTSYVMLYKGRSGTIPRIGRATSTDGISWTKDAGNPVLDIGAATSWDDSAVYTGGLMVDPDGTTWHMWYAGDPTDDAGGTALGYASSTNNGASWSKGSNNPVITLSASGLDSLMLGDTVWAYLDGSTVRIQYGAEKDTGAGTYFRGRMEVWINRLPQKARPNADVTDGNWLDAGASNTDLYASIDEPDTPNDADYIQSGSGPSSDLVEVGLSAVSDPLSPVGHILRYRIRLVAALVGGPMSLVDELRQGTSALSTPLSITDTLSSTTEATIETALTVAQTDSITDYSSLRQRATATQTENAPTLVGAGTAQFTATNAVTFTPGLPAGWAADDVFVMLAARGDNTAMTSQSGWVQVAALSGNNTTAFRNEVWLRRAVAGDTAPAVTFGSSTIVRGGRIWAIRGCPTSGTVDTVIDVSSRPRRSRLRM
jgi:hypothetical protein